MTGRPCVLVIGFPEPPILTAFRRFLDHEGFDSHEASDLLGAIKILRRREFDFLIIALTPSDEDPREDFDTAKKRFVESLNAIKRAAPGTPSLIIAVANQELRERDVAAAVGAMKAGALDFLRNPIDLDQLRSLMKRALHEKGRRDVFLCHASIDKERFVLPLARALDRQGVTYWLDQAEVQWGDSLVKTINAGLARSQYVIVFLTPNFFGRPWPQAELATALSRENSDGRPIVLPVLAVSKKRRDAAYPLLADKVHLRWRDGIDAIVEAIQTRLRRGHK